jgi:hypothetical protein
MFLNFGCPKFELSLCFLLSDSTKESPSLVKLSNCNPCVVWLSQQAYGFVFKVACQNRSFAPRDLYHFKRVVISEMKAQQVSDQTLDTLTPNTGLNSPNFR